MAASAKTMITTRLTVIFSRHWKLHAGFAALFVTLIIPYSAQALTPPFAAANVMRGKTASGYSYISGGISFDEQCAIERESHRYNLKLVFARPAGTLTAPIFLIIGFNNVRHVEKIWPRAPWFYIRLPSGGYTILARFKHEVVLLRDVYVVEGQPTTYLLRGN